MSTISTTNLRKYGDAPFRVAVVHGGPGVPGEMAPVARELSKSRGVLEPLQAESTLRGQVRELKTALRENGDLPLALIGYSWGAMLCFILTAENPAFVSKLILVSSAVFEDTYAADVMTTRHDRLPEEGKARLGSLLKTLGDSTAREKNAAFAAMGELLCRADSWEALPHESDVIEYRYDIYRSVWEEAVELRSSGELLAMGRRIQRPVVAIHGDRDPHPAQGVEVPLRGVLPDFKFIRLEDCGHTPWYERGAKDRFYAILEEEMS